MSETLPLEAELVWLEKLHFQASSGGSRLVLDSRGEAGPSPVQALALGLAGCMCMDVVHILERGRVPPAGMSARLRATRSATDPKRVLTAELHLVVSGAVPADKVERAIALSREKYCSVWHSLRQDIAFTTSFEVIAPEPRRPAGST
jgi:putative redox protein